MIETVVIAVVVAVGVVLLLGAINRAKAVACPRCGAKVPSIRKPTSLRQMLWGGWTCSDCGFEIDRNGRPILSPRPRP
jgi:predicted RNA-binding Zn-ribbon protein involved in translation (DUF1610 family)